MQQKLVKLVPDTRICHHEYGVGIVKDHSSSEFAGAVLIIFDDHKSGMWSCDGYAPDYNGRFFTSKTMCSSFNCEYVLCLKIIAVKHTCKYELLKKMFS